MTRDYYYRVLNYFNEVKVDLHGLFLCEALNSYILRVLIGMRGFESYLSSANKG